MDQAFRSWLREQMRVRNISQSEVARQIKASPSLISRYLNEDVRPGPIYAERLARLFRVDVAFVRELAGLDPEDRPAETLRAGELIGMVKRVNWRDDTRFTTVTGILRTYLDQDDQAEHG